ncbi:MAG: hypothetical protein ACR2G6_16065, partial [Gemmatimonadaceae bacterium]
MRCAVAVAMLTGVAAPASTQVGHLPGRSPFRDLVFKQEISLLTGYHAGSEGRAGVAPAGGPLLSAHSEMRLGGPSPFPACLARVWSKRTAIAP